MPSSSPEKLAAAVLDGDRRALARAITLIESSRPGDRAPANHLLELIMPHAGRSIRVGVSGVPGVGKSTFIESIGNRITAAGHRVAVLAVDPTSALSGGSILGDKTRMETLSRNPDAFIRPSPAGQTLGGVTRHTRETICLVEAAGFDVVIVETVGVGQSETAVAEMTDMFLLLLLPAGGDELQGIKRGIVELADLIVVNKADGNLTGVANQAAADYKAALRFMHARVPGWEVPVETCSAIEDDGIDRIWGIISRYRDSMTGNGELQRRRAYQAKSWLWSETTELLMETLRGDPAVRERVGALEEQVAAGKMSPWVGAQELEKIFLHRKE